MYIGSKLLKKKENASLDEEKITRISFWKHNLFLIQNSLKWLFLYSYFSLSKFDRYKKKIILLKSMLKEKAIPTFVVRESEVPGG